MKLPKALEKFGAAAGKLDASADVQSLVKVKTLMAWIAYVISVIPRSGAGIAVRRTPDGDVWTATAEARPLQVSSTGKVQPGLVGGRMPTLSGGALDVTSNVIDLTDFGGNFKVYFKLTFSVTYLSGFLSSYSLTSVSVEHAASIPSNTDSIKYLQLATVTGGAVSVSFFSTSIAVALYDNGAFNTTMQYASA